MRGPPKRPTHLKVLEGNPGKRRLNKDEPQPTAPIRLPPDHLSPLQKSMWREVVRAMPEGLYTQADRGTLERYCVSWAGYRELTEQIQSIGVLCRGREGQIVRNPLFICRGQVADDMHRCACELGLTPASRTRIEH